MRRQPGARQRSLLTARSPACRRRACAAVPEPHRLSKSAPSPICRLLTAQQPRSAGRRAVIRGTFAMSAPRPDPRSAQHAAGWPEYFSLSHKGHGGLLDPHIWGTCPKTAPDLPVLEPWPGFVRQADLCRAALHGECALLPPTGSPDRHGAGISVRRCMPHGVVILTAQPIAGHDAKGQRREPRPGRSRCRRRPGPGSGPDTGASPGSSACPAPGRRPCPRTPRQSRPPRPRPPRRSSKRLPEKSVSLPGITLSDEGGQGERARSRRCARQSGCPDDRPTPRRTGYMCAAT